MYQINEDMKNNILYFLNKVSFDGLREAEAAYQIGVALSNAVIDNDTQKEV